MSDGSGWLSSANLDFLEKLYARYLDDPAAVPPSWRPQFAALAKTAAPAAPRGPSFTPASVFHPTRDQCRSCAVLRQEVDVAARQDRVDQLVRAYRVRGHLVARLDPLDLPREPHPELDPSFYGLTERDLDRIVSSRTVFGAPDVIPVRDVLERLRNTYCRSIGVQFMHIDQLPPKMWLQERMEAAENRLQLSRADQLRVLTKLTDAVIFEEFLQRKYVGAKRFSLEGAESLIPLLDLAIERAGAQGVDEIVIGMAHRGRINVLANIIGKSARLIFAEFDDKDPELRLFEGDVKYHLGHSNDVLTSVGRKVHLSLCFNPSHLEFVNPVAMGRVRAKQDRHGDAERGRGMALLIHGDAAFAGQGVVQEALNMSGLSGYSTGGTLHVIVNNQIGFTTPPEEQRTSVYATDVAKLLQAPIFHVNGEDPEAVAQVVQVALDFRRTFRSDVLIDMYCYRRYGHSEGDEPEFTQPVMHRAIKQRKSVRAGYLEHLLALGEVTEEEAADIARQRREHLERELSVARDPEFHVRPDAPTGVWAGRRGGGEAAATEPETGVPAERLAKLLSVQTQLPGDFEPHPKLRRWLAARGEMAAGRRPLDWAAAEALALASVASAGHPVRLTGQDTQRGAFSQRHAVLHDVRGGRSYTPLQHVDPRQAPVEIRNSPLSEAGALGFEYGYSLDSPGTLVIWEAQFGDFCNAAQVIIDQFIVSAEDKWRRLSGLVLLLPHGFEGQGPEHSSARLERFLSLAAQDNIQVAQPTTPAQYFHVLRRQALRTWCKPLVLLTPKSLLRHPNAVSPLAECATGRFHRILPDRLERRGDDVRQVLLCSGKIYYELDHAREQLGRDEVAILRVEQLYPLSDERLAAALQPHRRGTPVRWVQEEPENMGAWPYLARRFGGDILQRWPLTGVHRPAAASPATGSTGSHRLEQHALLDRALAVGV